MGGVVHGVASISTREQGTEMSDADVMTKPGTTKPALLKGVPTSDSAPMQTLLKMSNICNPIVLSACWVHSV